MKMRSKKGTTLLNEEMLKIVVAALCIAVLFYLGVKLFSVFYQKSDIEQAKSTLEELEQKIAGLEEGQERSMVVTGPREWYIVAYDKDEINTKECRAGRCVCMCKGPESSFVDYDEIEKEFRDSDNEAILDYFYSDTGKRDCEKTGICKSFQDTEINHMIFIRSKIAAGRVKNVNWISFFEIPKNIYISKTNGKTSITGRKKETSIIDGFLGMRITTREEDSIGISTEDFLKQHMDCKLLKGEMAVPGLDAETNMLYYIIPGQERKQWQGQKHSIMTVLFGIYGDYLEAKGMGGILIFHYVSGESYKEGYFKIVGESCTSKNPCNRLFEEKLICDKDYKIYLRLFTDG